MLVIKDNEDIATKLMDNEDEGYANKIYINIEPFIGFYFNNHYSNCKVINLESIQGCLHPNSIVNTSKRIHELLDYLNISFFQVTLTNIADAKTLGKHFVFVGGAAVPIGYNDTFQYHITFGEKKCINGKYGAQIKKHCISLDTFISNHNGKKVTNSLKLALLKKIFNKLINGETLLKK